MSEVRKKPINPPIRRRLILDAIEPQYWGKLEVTYYCEQCSYYIPESEGCTMGLPTAPHRKEQQQKTYELTGRVAFCRYLEVD
jgi:hypothetical protein